MIVLNLRKGNPRQDKPESLLSIEIDTTDTAQKARRTPKTLETIDLQSALSIIPTEIDPHPITIETQLQMLTVLSSPSNIFP
jgi:hypothetical protein